MCYSRTQGSFTLNSEQMQVLQCNDGNLAWQCLPTSIVKFVSNKGFNFYIFTQFLVPKTRYVNILNLKLIYTDTHMI